MAYKRLTKEESILIYRWRQEGFGSVAVHGGRILSAVEMSAATAAR